AIVMFVKQTRKEPEQTKQEKKEENPTPPGPDGTPIDPKPKDKDPDPKPKDKDPDPKPKDKDPDPPGLTRPAVALPKLKTFTTGAVPANPEPADKLGAGMKLEAPITNVKRLFPPAKAGTDDTAVLIQTSAGVGGAGERLALDFYGPAGNRIAADRI